MKFLYIKLLLVLLFFVSLSAEIPYQVQFDGIHDKETIEVLRTVSQLVLLRDRPPATSTALQRRAEADLPNIVKGLQSLGYYEPHIELEVDVDSQPTTIHFSIDPGPVYTLSSFEIIPDVGSELPALEISPRTLGIREGSPIRPIIILNAENQIIKMLNNQGHPLATISKREVIADEESQTISVILRINSGLPAKFGQTTIKGNRITHDSVISKKIYWSYGRAYDPRKIERTQEALEASGLFSSVGISPSEEIDEEGLLPMTIEVSESKYRTIGFGLSYNTQLGPGFTAEWEHRNIRCRGEKVSIRTDLWKDLQSGTVLYTQPDFIYPGQDLLWIAEAERERTKGFTENFVTLSVLLDKRINECNKLSYGLTFKQLESDDTESDNGSFTLLKVPIIWNWSNADNLLNPTRGNTLYYHCIPTFQVIYPKMFYVIQTLTLTGYIPLTYDGRHVIATKTLFGSIAGETKKAIPAPERIYAGSESTLRGYRYLTVSPLNAENDPVGGRSLMVYSLELRSRICNKISWVTFFDVGNVYANVWPQFNTKQLKSAGFGIRYHTPVGPLRADFAVPLDRRRGLDNRWELYISIGQAF